MSIHQKSKSLQARGHELATTMIQLQVLNGDLPMAIPAIPTFGERLAAAGYPALQPTEPAIFQINIGKKCNQSCAHCHVDAGPDRQEMMSREHLEKCLALLAESPIGVVDITGGAPEMHPDFRWFVAACRQLGKKVMNRCNLTIIEANPKYADLPEFFAEHGVHVVSSLPYFSKQRTDAQRGDGVFEDSIKALRRLNAVGYGLADSGLLLDLVYNPSGAFLPGSQASLEREFKTQLARRFQLQFNRLLVITNMPISRFLEYLLASNNYAEYMQSLVNAFNPGAIEGLMCRNTISVSWDGYLYDCDFNQMLDLPMNLAAASAEGITVRPHLDQLDWSLLAQRQIVVNQHCYGCTAGAGSSCGGEIA